MNLFSNQTCLEWATDNAIYVMSDLEAKYPGIWYPTTRLPGWSNLSQAEVAVLSSAEQAMAALSQLLFWTESNELESGLPIWRLMTTSSTGVKLLYRAVNAVEWYKLATLDLD